MGTPYDGKVSFWHVKGSWVGEADIDALAQTIKTWCPVGDAIWVKTSEGNSWQGDFDDKPTMEINDAHDITRWVSTLANHELEFHAWHLAIGEDIPGEVARIIEAASVPGVRSMIMDVEPFENYWRGSEDDVIRLMSAVRDALGPDYHIGLSVDPRQNHYTSIFPDAWRPYVNSVHPQVYWEEMGRTPEDVLDEAYVVWGGYGLPIYPVLQGYADPSSIQKAQDLARSVRGATSLSYYRLGLIGPLEFPVINDEFVEEEIGPDRILRRYGWEKIISPDDSGYRDGTHVEEPSSEVFKTFTSARGHVIKYKDTVQRRSQVWAEWKPGIPERGFYEVSIYIPSRHATTTKARYHIHGVADIGAELLVSLNQKKYSNQWVPLVVYEFDPGPKGAQVNLTDLTGEDNKEIAFTAIRWRQVIEQEEPDERAGFDSPVGTSAERLTDEIWPGGWYDATGFAAWYSFGGGAYHTGVDLNLSSDRDREAPVYAAADGVVTFSGRGGGTWGWLINIRHDPLPDGTVVWSRSGHLVNPLVREGDRVERGQQIAQVGDAFGQLPYHLHFDIAKTNILETRPGHWPGRNLSVLLQHYIDPKEFIDQNRPPGRA